MDQRLASLIEQLRDIYTGRETYNSTKEWVDNLDATFAELANHPDVAFAFEPQANKGQKNDALEAWNLIQEADGAGLVLTDDNLLAQHVAANFGIEPEDVFPDYENPDEGDFEEDEEAEDEDEADDE